jgi:hypothetical protein
MKANTDTTKYISNDSKKMISSARVTMDNRLHRVSQAVSTFFEEELSRGFPGLSQIARDHLDRFRSFLHSFYIEQHGFWPPNNFDTHVVQQLICNSMYADFYSLYQHMADTATSPGMSEANVNTAGGVCTLQNIRAYDARHGSLPLPHALPRIPTMPVIPTTASTKRERRSSWNPVARHREDKERRNSQRLQALIDSTNRDWTLMNTVLVRRFSEFEIDAAIDDLEPISLADGRKVRWIVVYAILQSLISVTQAPKQVRNTEGLSYGLCCEVPSRLPWHVETRKRSRTVGHASIEPDNHHSHTNTEPSSPVGVNRTMSRTSTMTSMTESLVRMTSRASTTKDRRQTVNDATPGRTMSMKSTSSTRTSSLRRIGLYRSTDSLVEEPDAKTQQRPNFAKRTSFCEIYVPGYGNGLNEVELQRSKSEKITSSSKPRSDKLKRNSIPPPVPKLVMPAAAPAPAPTVTGANINTSVSRESSNASTNSTWSRTAPSASTPNDSDASLPTPNGSPIVAADVAIAMANLELDRAEKKRPRTAAMVHIVQQEDISDATGLDTVHFNTSTWDDMLNVLEKRRFNVV